MTLTFIAGLTTQTINVATFEDASVDGNEMFFAFLSGPSEGLELGTNQMATVTILEGNNLRFIEAYSICVF